MILSSDIVCRRVASAYSIVAVLSCYAGIIMAAWLCRTYGPFMLVGWVAGYLTSILGALHVARKVRRAITAALVKAALAW